MLPPLEIGTYMLRILLITSNHLRHKYIAHCLADVLQLTAVIAEQKPVQIEKPLSLTPENREINDIHFKKRSDSEKEFFGQYSTFPTGVEVLDIANGEVNSVSVQHRIASFNPDYIVLFGSSIIRQPLLEAYPNRIINLHLGLSPYYRGAATNLFPLYYGQPECVGATIHLATAKVDAGGILYQLRPDLDGSEDLYQLGNKVIQKAGNVLPMVINNFDKGLIQPHGQDLTLGKVYRNRDYQPQMIVDIEHNIREGMIKKYITNKEMRNSTFPIIAPIFLEQA
jgi:methionyl-tRNA formyltransferase